MMYYTIISGTTRRVIESEINGRLDDKTWERVKPRPNPDFTCFRPELEKLRKKLRFHRPRRLEWLRLGAKLLQLGATERSGGIPLIYPQIINRVMIQDVKKDWLLTIVETGYLYIPLNSKLSYLPNRILNISSRLNCHPAITLASVISDSPPEIYSVPTVFSDGSRLEIQVPSSKVSPELVRQAYTVARDIIIDNRRGIELDWARPREMTEKVGKLLDSREKNHNLNWKDYFEKWNAEYPEWTYDNLHLMQNIYYRAKNKVKEGKI